MLRAMQAELDREQAQLLLPGMQRPYFIEYRLDDIATYEAVANYGALAWSRPATSASSASPSASATTPPTAAPPAATAPSRSPPPTTTPTPFATLSGSPPTRPTRTPSAPTTAKQATLKRFQSPPRPAGLRHRQARHPHRPARHPRFDRDDWKQRIVEASGLYASDPEVSSFAADVQYSTANLRAIAVNRYLVNTEGTVVRQGYTGYAASISVGGQAADGMRLGRDNGTVAVDCQGPRKRRAFRKRTHR